MYTELSFWQWVLKGGAAGMFLIGLSVFSWWIIIERGIRFWKMRFDPAEFTDKIKKLIKAKDIDGALTLCQMTPGPVSAVVLAGIKNKGASKEEIEALTNHLVATSSLLGKFTGYELIANRAVGPNLQLLSYLIKYEKQPLRFTFVFYKPGDNWVIQNFSFDGNLIEELEESARVYLLNVYHENK